MKPNCPGDGVGDEDELEESSEDWGARELVSEVVVAGAGSDDGGSTSRFASPTSGRSRGGGAAARNTGESTRTCIALCGEEGVDLIAIAEEEERLWACTYEIGRERCSESSMELSRLLAASRWCSTRRNALRKASFSACASFYSSVVSASFIRSVATMLFA